MTLQSRVTQLGPNPSEGQGDQVKCDRVIT